MSAILFKLIEDNHTEEAIQLVKSKQMDANYTNFWGMNALMFSCHHNNPDIAMAIIETGQYNPDHISYMGYTALMYACRRNKTKSVALALLETGTSRPGHTSNDGNNALILASALHSADEVALAILNTAECDPGHVTAYGRTALMNAVTASVEVTKALIETGRSNPGYVNKADETALILACKQDGNEEHKIDNIAIARWLIQTGQSRPGHADRTQKTALIYACENNNPEMALILIATNESIPQHIDNHGNTALLYACMNRLSDVALALLRTGQAIPEYTNPRTNQSALSISTEYRTEMDEVVRELSTYPVSNRFSINVNRACYDVSQTIHVRLDDFLKEDPDNIAFMVVSLKKDGTWVPNHIAPIIGININQLAMDDSMFVYECKRTGNMRPDNINKHVLYYDFKKVVGVGDVVKEKQIIQVINYPQSNLFAVVETNVRLASTVSAHVLGPNPNYISARRCQPEQYASLYDIVPCIPEFGEMEPIPETKYATPSDSELIVKIKGINIPIPIDSTTTIGDIKRILERKQLDEKGVRSTVRLIWKGKELENEGELASSISVGDVVMALIRELSPHGGRKRKTQRAKRAQRARTITNRKGRMGGTKKRK